MPFSYKSVDSEKWKFRLKFAIADIDRANGGYDDVDQGDGEDDVLDDDGESPLVILIASTDSGDIK